MSRIQEARMRSIRPYKTGEQYLYAMKEDLAEWLKELYDVDINVEFFLEALETGVLLCHHANSITQVAWDFEQRYPGLSHKLQLPTCEVTCNDFAQPGTFQARDNVSNFIQWCRKEMGIKEVLMFETEDLVLRKNEKNFVLCLLEVARRATRFGMSAPTLIQMEEEIEEEIREDLNLPPEETPLPRAQRKPANFKNLDQMVQCLVSRCTCPVQFSMIKVSEGKYRVGDSNLLIFVRILRNHVMVRVGGGWDTLEHYLDKHDPCRCTSLSHKQALRAGSPQKMQATPVQHEITARLTPRKDNPKPQPALIVSRSQSPLPPVEWRTYTPNSPGWKTLQRSPPSNGGGGVSSSRKTTALLISPEVSEHRRVPSVRARSVTPTRRLPAPEERPASKPTLSMWSRREACPVLSQLNGSTENTSPVRKSVSEAHRGRSPARIPTPTPYKEKPERPASSRVAAPRAPVTRPPGRSQPEMNGPQTRSSSPAKHFQAPVESPARLQGGVTVHSWSKDSIAWRSPSSVKHAGVTQKEDSSAKTSGRVGPTSYRLPTIGSSYQEAFCFRNGGNTLGKNQGNLPRKELCKGRTPLLREQGKAVSLEASASRFSNSSGGGIGQKMKDGGTLAGQESVPGRPCKDGQMSQGDTKEVGRGTECVYTPLPIDPVEEQALYRSLEDEILANIKELEEVSEGNPISRGSRLGGFGVDCCQGRDAMALTCNGPRVSTPTWSSLPITPRTSVSEGSVPRSGVYVPEREIRWHPAGLHYDSVIQELSKTLHREHTGTEGSPPQSSPSLVNGNQAGKTFLDREGAVPEENCVAPEAEGREPYHTARVEVDGNARASQAMPSRPPDSPEHPPAPEDTKLPQSKPRRSLKKPERVPSIYKLKLRPKIRPRRDNRPEKRPSRIPTPITYRHAQRGSSVKAQAKKAHSVKSQIWSGQAGVRQNGSGDTESKDQAALSDYSLSATQDGGPGRKTSVTEGETEASGVEESWV
ncbi:GAS2-like protein 2 [Podarcis raffonei]|uniref:GAS2-like protein 2 n=1 Tax=Podarcis raffonei TaxID=65483 RepID=UPI0023293918|nr:GAS2-like protein 2 [Podarcis raffonei]